MKGLTVMIVGFGAREYVISTAYERNSGVEKIIVAPGNDFISYKREKLVVSDGDCNLKSPGSIRLLAEKYKPDLIDVAQDDALASGTVDSLLKHGFNVFGPTRKAARIIEAEKRLSKEFMQRHGIPTSDFQVFRGINGVKSKIYLERLFLKNPDKIVYVKASGLCGGKGALKAKGKDETKKRIMQMNDFGKAGEYFIIEDALEGAEFSYFVISDGENYKTLGSAKDYKRSFENDFGEQTGGMGAISPAKITEGIEEEIENELVSKAIDGMRKEKIFYKGILYVGGILVDGKPFCIEYNARWGDPETQVILPGLQNDYIDVVQATIDGRLNEIDLVHDGLERVCVVGVAKGYPDTKSAEYKNSQRKRIFGLEEVMKISGINVYGAGIKLQNGKFFVNGGRLFSVVGKGKNLKEAREKSYDAISRIKIEGNNLHYRKDIGKYY